MSRYIDAELADALLTEGCGIDEVPTADVAPVVHASWEKGFLGIALMCSNCNVPSPNPVYYKYCPNCGAKMDMNDENEGYFTIVCKAKENEDDN